MAKHAGSAPGPGVTHAEGNSRGHRRTTAGATGAALASIMGTHYGFTKQVALLHLLKAQRVDSPAPELLRIIEGNSYTNRKDPTPVPHDEQGLWSQGTWCCQSPGEPLLGRESSAEVRRWG